jgi:hypothetical protein
MASSCPICADRKFRLTLDQLIATGGDLTAAKVLCDNEWVDPKGEGREITTHRIKTHAIQHTEIDPAKLHESFTAKPKQRITAEERQSRELQEQAREAVVKNYLDEVATIDVPGILGGLGVKSQPDSMGDVLNIVQAISLDLHLKAGAIAIDRMARYAKDPEGRRFPSVELKGAAMTSEMVAAAFGYQQAVSIQTAAETVERAGYEVVERGQGIPPALPGKGT